MIAKDLVYDEAVMPVFGFDNHDLFALGHRSVHLKILTETDVGDNLAAHVGDVFAVRVQDILAGEFNTLEAVGEGQYKMRFPYADQQSVDNR